MKRKYGDPEERRKKQESGTSAWSGRSSRSARGRRSPSF